MIPPIIQSVIAIVSDTHSGNVENYRSKQFLLSEKEFCVQSHDAGNHTLLLITKLL